MRFLRRQEAEAAVRRFGWLSETDRHFQDRLLARCDLLAFKPTQYIYQAGDEGGGLVGVVAGQIEIHLPVQRLDSTLIYLAGPGFWTGEAAAVRGHARLISLIARTHCQLLRLPRYELQRMTAADPSFWRFIAILIAGNERRTLRVIDALRCNDPVRRIATMLTTLLGDSGTDGRTLEVSQAELAAMCNLARGSISAGLRKLEQRGLIRRRYGAIEVGDCELLRHFAERLPRKRVA
ncbi:MAG TPA: Crp/Fnr family transcriptional regulator [Terriglobales bacterium]